MTTTTTTTTLTETITARLLAGESPAAIAADLGLDTAVPDECESDSGTPDSDAVLLAGYVADDGTAAETIDASTAEDAAQEYADTGDWGDDRDTSWLTVYVWRVGLALLDGEVVEVEVDKCGHDIELPAIAPDCEPACEQAEHDFREVPGSVRGNGGGVIVDERCAHCGCIRTTDTWATRPDTGEQGLVSESYR